MKVKNVIGVWLLLGFLLFITLFIDLNINGEILIMPLILAVINLVLAIFAFKIEEKTKKPKKKK